MKKTDFTEEASRLVVKEQRRDHRVENPRRVPKLLVKILILIATTANSKGTCRRISPSTRSAKEEGGPRADGVSTSGKQTNQAGIAKKALEESCDIL